MQVDLIHDTESNVIIREKLKRTANCITVRTEDASWWTETNTQFNILMDKLVPEFQIIWVILWAATLGKSFICVCICY